VKTAAQQLAFEARLQLEEEEAAQRLARTSRIVPAPPDFLRWRPPICWRRQGGSAGSQDARRQGAGGLNFALDRMDDAERREWEALQAEARAETHARLADDPLFKKP